MAREVAAYPLVAVVGPTSSGKSHTAIDVASRLAGEIVNCDSLQIYRGMNIGTAKTPIEHREGIPHHLFDLLEPWQVFSAGEYARAARLALAGIRERGRLPVIVGGTGFYLRALLDGLANGPGRSDDLRRRLVERERKRPGRLHRILSRLDQKTAAAIHHNDLQKTVRALEICLVERKPAVEVFAGGRRRLEGFRVLKLGLCPKRELLVTRIEQRTRAMFLGGLIEEVEALIKAGTPRGAKAFESIGYKEALAYLEGRIGLAEAVDAAVVATRQYAKRQMTWFRRDAGIHWFEGFGDEAPVVQAALKHTQDFLDEFTDMDYPARDSGRIA